MNTETLAYAPFAVLIFWALFGLVAPLFGLTWIKRNKGAEKNGLLWVEMMRADLVKRTGQHFNGLLSQAVCERWISWIPSLFVPSAAVFWVGDPLAALLLALVGPFLTFLVIVKLPLTYRQIDLIGRGCETLIARQDAEYSDYLSKEAARLIKGHRRNFVKPARMTAEQWQREVEGKIAARFGIAGVLIGLLKRNWS